MKEHTNLFTGNIPFNYDALLGPFLFAPHAAALVNKLPLNAVSSILELACGTGILTTRLSNHFANSAGIVATDYSDSMLQQAKLKLLNSRNVRLQTADAHQLPFADNSFELVVCQFGIMFFADQPAACREIYRVLSPDGSFIFNTWNSMADNPATKLVNDAITGYFGADAPHFFETPHGMNNAASIIRLLSGAGFANITHEVVEITVENVAASTIARGFVTGTPMFGELVRLDPSSPEKIIAIAEEKLAVAYGGSHVPVTTSALFFSAHKNIIGQ
ncbi:methyltransferase domain-containing protein [Panacibacter sp. DH6]|uniref:Methyltransferase domain-containing protein n=1 Tax=Panacibacter microcysteis TaxID=2793269 RepID=A0A931E7X1_9BACT|nr:methyltransferase domain-containing protein [Panacibacter microcysteis]MBG9376910.1 methyltransferase domain-containing protein [Panacibacter microcysteis]